MPVAWFCLPSARPSAEANPIFELWRRQGYGVAVLRKGGPVSADVSLIEAPGEYQGWAWATNKLAAFVLEHDARCQWVIAAGDDTQPDLNFTAGEIAGQFTAHLGGTFGVCQPTGDRWYPGHPRGGCSIDWHAGSPWLGRDWCLRAHGGGGPLWPELYHNFADEMLQEVATRLGVFWQRRDIIHYHDHVARRDPRHWLGKQPPWHAEAHGNSYARDKVIFDRLAATGFATALEVLPASSGPLEMVSA